MAKNEFLPFGTAANANVLSPDDYQALASRATGFAAGVAKSKELNTAWRQASVIASVVAQFITDNSGKDALDNGDTQTLKSNLELAFAEQAKKTLPFNQSLGANGYQKLPSGLVMQWGSGTTDPSTNSSLVSFPTPFTKAIYQVVASPTAFSPSNYIITVGPTELSHFSIFSTGATSGNIPNTGSTIGFRWMAIGQ